MQRRILGILAFTAVLVLSAGVIWGQKAHPSNFTRDDYVQRALVLMDHPLSHLINFRGWAESGLPDMSNASREDKVRIAEKDLSYALQVRADGNPEYSAGEIYSFLAIARSQLAALYQVGYETSKTPSLRIRSKRYYGAAFQTFENAIGVASGELKYVIAIDYVETVIQSGDLNRALALIEEYDSKQLNPRFGGDYVLSRIKAEIYWIMKRNREAALTYERWIDKGGADYVFAPTSLIYQRLTFLKKETGHPKNFPTVE
jgi:hypothetical protein